MLLLDGRAVSEAFPMGEAIEVMAEVMRRYSAGLVTQPLRTVLRPGTGSSLFAVMPCHVAADPAAGAGPAAGLGGGYGLKAIMLNPGNAQRGLPEILGSVLVFDPETGDLAAVLDGAAVTAVRTAAVSAVATRVLAAPGAGDLAILGSGVQARSHLEAMSAVRPLRRVRVWSRTPEHARQFAAWAADRVPAPTTVAASVAEALAGADLVCTTLACREPVVAAEHLAPGAHVNAVGASVAECRELESAAVARCTVFVDSRESAANESGDLRVPAAEGVIPADHVRAELGEVLLGRAPGRTRPDEITLYESVGMAAQDVAAGFAIVHNATRLGLGHRIPLR